MSSGKVTTPRRRKLDPHPVYIINRIVILGPPELQIGIWRLGVDYAFKIPVMIRGTGMGAPKQPS